MLIGIREAISKAGPSWGVLSQQGAIDTGVHAQSGHGLSCDHCKLIVLVYRLRLCLHVRFVTSFQ